MVNRIFCRVKKVAQIVVKLTEQDFPQEFLETLPVDLCQVRITDKNINQVIARVNHLRREKEDTLEKISNLKSDEDDKLERKIHRLLDDSINELPFDKEVKEALEREIKFFSILGQSIYKLQAIETTRAKP